MTAAPTAAAHAEVAFQTGKKWIELLPRIKLMPPTNALPIPGHEFCPGGPGQNLKILSRDLAFRRPPLMEMSREGVAGGPGGPVPDRRWMEMSASISSTGYRVACTVSASYGQGLGEAGQIRGADRGTSAVPGRLSRDPLAGPI